MTVELLGGQGEELWRRPGRILAVGPSHTFMDLADAINGAFARWDRGHLSLSTLADGRLVTDAETDEQLGVSLGGPMTTALDIVTVKVAKVLGPGAEFQFTFDLGDEWIHRCVVDGQKIDPEEELGIRPKAPTPYWGWGSRRVARRVAGHGVVRRAPATDRQLGRAREFLAGQSIRVG